MVTKLRKGFGFFTMIGWMFLLNSCVPLGTLPSSGSATNGETRNINKPLLYEDKNYEEYVGNVILNSTNPIVPLSEIKPIQLEFDLLTSKFENLQAKYVHCNFDWKPSQLRELEYLKAFNRFDHKSFDYSSNTKTPYIQYFFELDRPKVSGNYLVILYRRDNPNDILFTRRMIFFENRLTPTAEIRLPRQVKQRRTHQQVDFSLNFNSLEAPDPKKNFNTLLVQNKNWNSAIENLEPTAIQPAAKTMSWEYFTGENQFPGWNQFRWLDLRTLVVRGINVNHIKTGEKRIDVYQGIDSDHGSDSYRQLINDNNGRYIPGNSDPGEPWLEADYAYVHFTLKSDQDVGKVWVMGRFNEWRKDASNQMSYYPEVGAYQATIRLKQGYYDYRYEVESSVVEPYHFEGAHFQAENEYDLLIYYRAPGRINDRVVGLLSLNSVNFF